jgi:peptide/nickel transport system permease protein
VTSFLVAIWAAVADQFTTVRQYEERTRPISGKGDVEARGAGVKRSGSVSGGAGEAGKDGTIAAAATQNEAMKTRSTVATYDLAADRPRESEQALRQRARTRIPVADVWRTFRRTPGAVAGAAIVVLIVVFAVGAPLLASGDPLAQNLAQGAQPPGPAHPFGTDKLGRDLFARILYGARISIQIGFVAVGLAITAGTLVGLVAGYAGKRLDAALMGAMDLMLAFPSIILAIAITTILGPSINNLMIAVGIVYLPQYARLARSSVLAVKEHEYVEAARALGAGVPAILARHVLPNIASPLLVQATLGIATAELEAAGLSYLGLGARPPAPEWGAMLNDARDYWLGAPWALIFPGLSITLLVLGFNLLGDGLRDALDPRGR